ncbi:MAG: hypothetical protein N2439_10770 [Anaerolineae bacterium]|nr:hypothetical protein [Anaerolineae bacterium]
MASTSRFFWVGLSGLLLALLACSSAPRLFPGAATSTPTAQVRRGNEILPAMTRAATATRRPFTATPLPQLPSPVPPRPTAGQKPVVPGTTPTSVPPAATATPDPHRVVITEEEIARAIAAGAGAEQGLSAQGLQVRLRAEQMTLAADELNLGPVQVKQLVMVGRLFAENGELHFESVSVSPRGLVTSLLPALADQALSRYAARWYVEEVHLLDGRLELRIR